MVKHLDAAVAPVCHEHSTLRIHLDVVRVAEPECLLAFRPDRAADRQQELASAVELDNTVIAPTVSVGHPDVAIRCHHHARWPVEVRLVVTPYRRLAEPHHDLTLLVQLEHLMADTQTLAQGGPSVSVRTTFGHPQEPLVVEKKTVRKPEQPGPEAVDQVTLEIELHDRVEVGASALVGAAPVHDPEVLSVRIREHAAHRAHHPAFWQLLPPERRAIRIGGRRLRVESGERPEHRERDDQRPEQR